MSASRRSAPWVATSSQASANCSAGSGVCEVIQREDDSRVHFIPMGGLGDRPLQRLHIVIGALVHTYDKVVVVARCGGDWPHEQVR
jgi:hypothetical protein